jgi:hypothetical protein
MSVLQRIKSEKPRQYTGAFIITTKEKAASDNTLPAVE